MNIATFIIRPCLFSLVDSSFLLKRVVDIATFIIPIYLFTLANSSFLLKRVVDIATFIIPIYLFTLASSSFLLERVANIATFIIPNSLFISLNDNFSNTIALKNRNSNHLNITFFINSAGIKVVLKKLLFSFCLPIFYRTSVPNKPHYQMLSL